MAGRVLVPYVMWRTRNYTSGLDSQAIIKLFVFSPTQQDFDILTYWRQVTVVRLSSAVTSRYFEVSHPRCVCEQDIVGKM
jgi:hypothetical protein